MAVGDEALNALARTVLKYFTGDQKDFHTFQSEDGQYFTWFHLKSGCLASLRGPLSGSAGELGYPETVEELDSLALDLGLKLGRGEPRPGLESTAEAESEVLGRLLPCPTFQVGADGALTAMAPLPEKATSGFLLPSLCLRLDSGSLFVFRGSVEGRDSLWSAVTFNSELFATSEFRLLLVMYQVLGTVAACARAGLYPSAVSPHAFRVESNLWLRFNLPLAIQQSPAIPVTPSGQEISQIRVDKASESWEAWTGRRLDEATSAWSRGRLSNFDYLMLLNHFAGRLQDDPERHPMLPWVCDFSMAEGGWRDLKQTKYRLNKGEAQLRQTMAASHHHVPELLSDLGFFVYKARVTPQGDLRRAVRSQWVPEEYPASLRRLYEWTPDEAIPEFYADPAVFTSAHPDMPDLALPSWTATPDEFVVWHRGMLECDWVATRLHHWIDLAFGYKLSGAAAEEALNVQLALVETSSEPRHHGPVQLFAQPHPHRTPTSELSGQRMDEVFSAVMNPLYLLSQQPPESFTVDEHPTDLRKLSREITRRSSVEAVDLRVLESVVALALELCFPMAFRQLPRNASPADRLRVARRLFTSPPSPIPRCLGRALSLMLESDSERSLVRLWQWTQPLCSPLAFPHFLPPLVETLGAVASTRSGTPPTTLEEASAGVHLLGRYVSSESDWLSAEAAELLAAVAAELATEPAAVAQGLWTLFAPLTARLSRATAQRLFAGPIRVAFRVTGPATTRHLKLYHRTFLLQLLVRLGTHHFLVHILPSIIQASLGDRDELLMEDSEFLAATAAEETRTSLQRTTSVPSAHSSQVDGGLDDQDLTSELSLHFDIEETADDPSEVLSGIGDVSYSVRDEDTCSTPEEEEEETSSRRDMGGLSLGEVARESLLWLGERLGPVLSSQYIARGLMEALWSGERGWEGGRRAEAAVATLRELAALYGDALILLQFVPTAVGAIRSASRRFGPKEETAVLAAVALLQAFFPFFTDKQLMDNLQEVVVDALLFPAVRILSSLRLSFQSPELRSTLAESTLNALHGIGSRVGAENFKRHMAAPLQRLLCTYDALFRLQPPGQVVFRDEEAKGAEQLRTIFTPIYAARIFRLFSGLCGKRYFELSLPNSSLLMKLVEMGRWAAAEAASPALQPTASSSSLQLHLASSPLNNHALNSPDSPQAQDLIEKLPKSDRALRGHWLSHWEREIGRRGREEKLELSQEKLTSFIGHSASVRIIDILENENSFLSASADKTIRLWSLRNAGDGTHKVECQWTYRGHRKAALDVGLVESLRLYASTDGASLHIWDPFLGATLRDVDLKGAEVVGLRALSGPSRLGVVATSDAGLRLLDLRQADWAAEFKLSGLPIRAMAVQPSEPHAVVLVHPAGQLSAVDVRTGRLSATRKIGDGGEISQIRSVSDQLFCISVADNPVSLWNFSDLSLNARMGSTLDGQNGIESFGSQLLLSSTSNRIRIYEDPTRDMKYSETKLRSELLGNTSLSTLKVLPLNRILLVGTSSGVIHAVS